jgi:hypothetical protein
MMLFPHSHRLCGNNITMFSSKSLGGWTARANGTQKPSTDAGPTPTARANTPQLKISLIR